MVSKWFQNGFLPSLYCYHYIMCIYWWRTTQNRGDCRLHPTPTLGTHYVSQWLIYNGIVASRSDAMDMRFGHKIFIVKFQITTYGAWGGNFIWYFKECQHWIFPKHNYKRVVSLSIENDFQELSSCVLFSCELYAAIYTMRSFFVLSTCDKSYWVQNTPGIQRLKFGTEPMHLSVSMSQRSNHLIA